uniref:G-protein coupled receptors family 1 profile domain-containing protein n=1 Tax=Podarcis muralis TaxID=64176 RepID=A0A670JIY9_PODMU
MANNGLHSPIPLGAEEEYNRVHNATGLPDYTDYFDEIPSYDVTIIIILVCIFLISVLGLLGNGTVIWILGFCMKRTAFATYILNLAVADLGVLLGSVPWRIIVFLDNSHSIDDCLLSFTYNTGQLLLTAISIDRCVSVLFPIWHRCVRPTHLSTTVCALIWVLSCLLSIVLSIITETSLIIPDNIYFYFLTIYFQFILTGLLCLPLMTISTVILFFKVCFKSHPRKRGRLLMVILLTLLFFLILAFPINAILLDILIVPLNIPFPFHYAILCASLNSCVNPLLYFLVGRKKGGQSRESLLVILQRVLNEEVNDRQEMDPPCSIPLRNLS